MAGMTEAQRNSRKKYRKENTHTFIVYFPNAEYDKISAYCKHINSPVATWVRKIIHENIDSDPTFVYNPEENGGTDED